MSRTIILRRKSKSLFDIYNENPSYFNYGGYSQRKLCNVNECLICYQKSFSSIENLDIGPKKMINPRDVFKGTKKKF